MNSYNLSLIRDLPKSDLHSHAGRGGRIKYIEHWAGIKITPNDKPFKSLSEMQSWFENNIKGHCPGINGYLKRIEAAFVQAADDHIKVLTLSYGIGEIDSLGGMIPFIRTMEHFRTGFAPDTLFFPELALGREQDVDDVASRLDEIFSAVENLELDEVHHGIAAARSDRVMRFLSDNKIRLNICPTSNIMLKTAKSYAAHPIRILWVWLRSSLLLILLCCFNS